MMHDALKAVAQVSAERMIDSLLIGLALAGFAWTLLRVLPRQNSATRFAVWFASLIGTAVLPWLEGGPGSPAAKVAPALHPLISAPSSWAVYLFAAWVVIATVALLRIGSGLLELRRLRRSCREVTADAHWQEMVARFCPARRVEILSSDHIHVPTAVGFIRPAVVIPARLLQELSAPELEQILLHELAHLRRWDDWTNVAQKFVKALLFFHPAVWWMEERLSLEREMACDDAVLAETRSPRAYAECLANLAEKSVVRRNAALAQAAVHRIRQTTLRVARILDVNRPKAAPARKAAPALLAGFACAMAVVAWHAPRLVAFQDPPPAPAMAPAATIEQPLAVARIGDAAPRPMVAAVKRRARQPAVIPAKAAIEHAKPGVRPPQPDGMIVPEQQGGRVIQAKAAVAPQPTLTTGVLVIFVDDPVLGPTPVLWRFAIWQVAPPQHAAHTSEEATPQKSI